MDYPLLKTKGVFAVNCQISDLGVRIGMLILTARMERVRLSPLVGEAVLVDLTGIETGVSYQVNILNAGN